jgi:hypothetical protein
MNPWISMCGTVSVGLLAIAATFYNRFVPDVNAQKRHLKLLGIGAFNLLVICSQVVAIHRLAHSGAPVTPGFVVMAAFDVGGFIVTVLSLLSLYFLRLINKLVNSHFENSVTFMGLQGRMIGISQKHQNAIQRSADAIVALATQPGVDPDAAGRVCALMTNLYAPQGDQ